MYLRCNVDSGRSARRAALSKTVNHLLELNPPQPFDFVVDENRLPSTERVSLCGLSVETVIAVKYIPVVLSPKRT